MTTATAPSIESVMATLEMVAERQRETARQMKETEKKISSLGSRFGEMVEHMVMPNLIAKFREHGFMFTKANRNTEIEDKENNIYAEIDITLEDGDKVMVVEVKTKPAISDVKDHVERMEKIRAHADFHNDKRKYLGAVAGVVMNSNVKEFSFKNGFYVVEPSGETFNISKPEGIYAPREW